MRDKPLVLFYLILVADAIAPHLEIIYALWATLHLNKVGEQLLALQYGLWYNVCVAIFIYWNIHHLLSAEGKAVRESTHR